MLIPELMTVPTVVVPVPVKWFWLVPILPAILPVALVSRHVIASFLPARELGVSESEILLALPPLVQKLIGKVLIL